MTKQQIEKMAQVMCGFCTEDKRCVLKYSAPCSDIASQDCTCKESAEELIHKGYGGVSEYKAEIERLKENLKNLKDDFESLQKDYEFVRDCDAEHCLEINETVKQAQIDVLNRVMTYINNKIENDYGDMSDSVKYLTVDIDDFDDFIDELIKET